MNKIKLAAFDIDGTIFDEKKKEFPESTIYALKKLNENNIKVILVTGRPPRGSLIIRDLGVKIDGCVCCNGHLVLDDKQNVILDKRFDKDLVSRVWEYCQRENIGLVWKYPDKTCIYKNNEEFEKIFNKNTKYNSKNKLNLINDSNYHFIETGNNGLLGCSIEQLNKFNETFKGECVAVNIDGKTADLLLYGVTKQVGLDYLLKYLNISNNECISFGDNDNDVEVINYVGLGVAMGNGSKTIKENANYITDDIDKDGVLNALTHFNLI